MAAPTPIALSPHQSPAFVPVLMAPCLGRKSSCARNLSTHPQAPHCPFYQGGSGEKRGKVREQGGNG